MLQKKILWDVVVSPVRTLAMDLAMLLAIQYAQKIVSPFAKEVVGVNAREVVNQDVMVLAKVLAVIAVIINLRIVINT